MKVVPIYLVVFCLSICGELAHHLKWLLCKLGKVRRRVSYLTSFLDVDLSLC